MKAKYFPYATLPTIIVMYMYFRKCTKLIMVIIYSVKVFSYSRRAWIHINFGNGSFSDRDELTILVN